MSAFSFFLFPIPTVVHIVEAHGIPLPIADDRGEYVTPIGAAFAEAIVIDWELPKQFRFSSFLMIRYWILQRNC